MANHVHKLLQVMLCIKSLLILMSYVHLHVQTENITKLCTNVCKVNSHPSLTSETQAASEKFTTVFRYLSQCHKGYNSNMVTEADIDAPGKLAKCGPIVFSQSMSFTFGLQLQTKKLSNF